MAKTEHYYTKFESEKFYHIYNRTVDRKLMFKNDGNYDFFLRRFEQYLSPVIKIYAYCLLGNHFHFLIKIRSSADLTTFIKLSNLPQTKSTHDIVSHQFRKFFQSYAMAFNKQQNRIGTLFQTPFKRVAVTDEFYFARLVYYIHANPQVHGLVLDFRKWKWSSYHKIIQEETPAKLEKNEVLEWFYGKEAFIKYQSDDQPTIMKDDAYIEDRINGI
jgi:putative transposase